MAEANTATKDRKRLLEFMNIKSMDNKPGENITQEIHLPLRMNNFSASELEKIPGLKRKLSKDDESESKIKDPKDHISSVIGNSKSIISK